MSGVCYRFDSCLLSPGFPHKVLVILSENLAETFTVVLETDVLKPFDRMCHKAFILKIPSYDFYFSLYSFI